MGLVVKLRARVIRTEPVAFEMTHLEAVENSGRVDVLEVPVPVGGIPPHTRVHLRSSIRISGLLHGAPLEVPLDFAIDMPAAAGRCYLAGSWIELELTDLWRSI